MHEAGKIVAVWVETDPEYKSYDEDEDFYRKIYDLKIDMLTTNQPDIARKFFQAFKEE